MFIIETSHGAQAGTVDAKWFAAKYASTLAQARAGLADTFADKLAAEDRGDEYERGVIKLRDMQTKEEKELPAETAAEEIRNIIG